MPIRCRQCGAEGQHFTHQCPQKVEGHGIHSSGSSKQSAEPAGRDAVNPSAPSAAIMEIKSTVPAEVEQKGDASTSTSVAREKPRLTFMCKNGAKSETSLQRFLKLKPSDVDFCKWSWLAILAPKLEPGEPGEERPEGEGPKEHDAAKLTWNQASVGLSGVVAKTLLFDLAVQHRILSAKWFFAMNQDWFDALWPLIANAVALGRLGHYAKHGPAYYSPGLFLCCVYVDDFRDAVAVRRVRDELASIIASCDSVRGPVELSLKPDIFTDCGVYANNKWKVPPILEKFGVPRKIPTTLAETKSQRKRRGRAS